MRSNHDGINRRDFLKQSALAGMGLVANASLPKVGYAASADRLTILTSVSLSSLDPYAFSSSPEYGIWNHMAESLIEVDYVKMDYAGVLAESWEFQGKKMGLQSQERRAFSRWVAVYR
jgi:ABC-type transport system substrate-binding protein